MAENKFSPSWFVSPYGVSSRLIDHARRYSQKTQNSGKNFYLNNDWVVLKNYISFQLISLRTTEKKKSSRDRRTIHLERLMV